MVGGLIRSAMKTVEGNSEAENITGNKYERTSPTDGRRLAISSKSYVWMTLRDCTSEMR